MGAGGRGGPGSPGGRRRGPGGQGRGLERSLPAPPPLQRGRDPQRLRTRGRVRRGAEREELAVKRHNQNLTRRVCLTSFSPPGHCRLKEKAEEPVQCEDVMNSPSWLLGGPGRTPRCPSDAPVTRSGDHLPESSTDTCRRLGRPGSPSKPRGELLGAVLERCWGRKP